MKIAKNHDWYFHGYCSTLGTSNQQIPVFLGLSANWCFRLFVRPLLLPLHFLELFFKNASNTRGANASIITGVTLSVLSMGYKFYVNYAGIEDVLPALSVSGRHYIHRMFSGTVNI